jgi:hypothetical protein
MGKLLLVIESGGKITLSQYQGFGTSGINDGYGKPAFEEPGIGFVELGDDYRIRQRIDRGITIAKTVGIAQYNFCIAVSTGAVAKDAQGEPMRPGGAVGILSKYGKGLEHIDAFAATLCKRQSDGDCILSETDARHNWRHRRLGQDGLVFSTSRYEEAQYEYARCTFELRHGFL